MEYNYILSTLVAQLLSAGMLAMWWAGVYLIREMHDEAGWGYLGLGTLMIVPWSYLFLRQGGWVDLGLIVGLPALLSIPAYLVYRSKEQARTFIWGIIALAVAVLILTVVGWYVVIPGGPIGYGSLVAGALVGGLCVYLFQKYALRPAPYDRQRGAVTSRWATLGTILGLTVGAAIVRGAMEVLGPKFSTIVLAFLGGWLGFLILGISGWALLWEIKKRRG